MAVARRHRADKARRRLELLLAPAIQLAGLAGLVLAVYLVVVVGIGRVPTADQRTLLGFSMAAAAVTALLYQPLRGWLSGLAARLAGPKRDSPGEVLRTLGSRLTSALPPRRAPAPARRVAPKDPGPRGRGGLDWIRRTARAVRLRPRGRSGQPDPHSIGGSGRCARGRPGIRLAAHVAARPAGRARRGGTPSGADNALGRAARAHRGRAPAGRALLRGGGTGAGSARPAGRPRAQQRPTRLGAGGLPGRAPDAGRRATRLAGPRGGRGGRGATPDRARPP